MSDDTTEYTFLEPWRGVIEDAQIAAGYAATQAQAAQWAAEAAATDDNTTDDATEAAA